jgi:hypothetical protein
MYKDGALESGVTGVGLHEQASDVYEHAEVDVPQFAEAGPKNLQFIPLNQIRLLEQPRRQYDPKEIESLAWAMVRDRDAFDAAETLEDITDAIDLYHTPIMNKVSTAYLPQYLEDHAKFYNIKTPIVITEPDEDFVYINSGGHTRYLAFQYLLKLKGHTIDDGRMLCQVRENLTHAETLVIQLRENKKSNPKPQDIAYVIERLANVHEDEHGTKPTAKYLSAYTGLSEDVVRDGLAFTSLPREIQDYLGDPRKERAKRRNGKDPDPVLPYTVLARFKPYQEAVSEKYIKDNADSYDYEAHQKYVTLKLHQLAKIVADRYIRPTSETPSDVLTGYIKMAQDALNGQQDELIFIEEAYDEGAKHERVSSGLSKRCLAVLRLMAEQGHLKASDAAELLEINALFAANANQADS